MDITILWWLIWQYWWVMWATKIIVDFIKKLVPIPDEHKSWALPLIAIVIAWSLNYAMKWGIWGINDFLEWIVLGLSTSKTHDILKTEKKVSEPISEEEMLLFSKFDAHDTSNQ